MFLQGSSKLEFLKLGFTLLTSLRFFVSLLCFDSNFLRYLRILSKNPQAAHNRGKRVHSHSNFDSSINASVLMQMENFNQVSFDPCEDIYRQLALRHSVKYQATHTMQVFPIQLVCLYKVRGKW